MSSDGDDLRATQDAIVADTDRLRRLETRKRQLEEDDPELAVLSAEAERLAGEVLHKATAEKQLTEEMQAAADA